MEDDIRLPKHVVNRSSADGRHAFHGNWPIGKVGACAFVSRTRKLRFFSLSGSSKAA